MEPKKLGRPPQKNNKSKQIQIRFTEEEVAVLEEAWNLDKYRGERFSSWLGRKLIENSNEFLSKK